MLSNSVTGSISSLLHSNTFAYWLHAILQKYSVFFLLEVAGVEVYLVEVDEWLDYHIQELVRLPWTTWSSNKHSESVVWHLLTFYLREVVFSTQALVVVWDLHIQDGHVMSRRSAYLSCIWILENSRSMWCQKSSQGRWSEKWGGALDQYKRSKEDVYESGLEAYKPILESQSGIKESIDDRQDELIEKQDELIRQLNWVKTR